MKTCGGNGPVKNEKYQISAQKSSIRKLCCPGGAYLICIAIVDTISLCWPIVAEANRTNTE